MTRKHPLAKCEECPLQRAKYVPSDIPQGKPLLAIVGESPGQTEVRKGKPFIGISGKLLAAVMKANGIKRGNTVMTNAVSCRPIGKNLPQEAIDCCKPRLMAELEDVETVMACGNAAATSLLGRKTKILTDRIGPPKWVDGKRIIPTIHPAACLRAPDNFPFLETDFRKIRQSSDVSFVPPKYKVFDDETANIALEQIIRTEEFDPITIDIETGRDKDEDFSHPDQLLCVGLGYKPGRCCIIGEEALRSTKTLGLIAKLLRTKKLILQNAKYDLQVFETLGICDVRRPYWDTLLASYCLDERPGNGTHGLEYLGREFVGAPDWKKQFKQSGKGRKVSSYADYDRDDLYKYNAYDVEVTRQLYEIQKPQVEAEDQIGLLEFLMDISAALQKIELGGIYIDTDVLDRLDKEYAAILEETKAELQSIVIPKADELVLSNPDDKVIQRLLDFNPNSPQQVARALLEVFDEPVRSTDEDTLRLLISEWSPAAYFCEQMLKHRKVGKLHGTYVKGIRKRLRPDGRIKSSFLIHGSTTGRLSSRNPNVQNVPREGYKGMTVGIKDMYVPEPGNLFINADFGNIEGRITCILSQCERMANLFREGRDLHGEVCERFFGEGWTKEQRVIAKSIVHGTNYGRTAHGIAADPDIPVDERTAEKFIKFYKSEFPEIFAWQDAVIHQVVKGEGFLTTPFGRKRRFTLITNENYEDITKEAIAFQPQSIASDIMMRAVVKMVDEGINVKIPVHDNALVEAPKGAPARMVADRMVEIMQESAQEFSTYIPWTIDVEFGYSWGSLSEQE